MAVSIVRANGRRGVLTVEVGLDVPDPRLRESIELYLPILYSAYVSALQGHGDEVGIGRLAGREAEAIGLQRRHIGRIEDRQVELDALAQPGVGHVQSHLDGEHAAPAVGAHDRDRHGLELQIGRLGLLAAPLAFRQGRRQRRRCDGGEGDQEKAAAHGIIGRCFG